MSIPYELNHSHDIHNHYAYLVGITSITLRIANIQAKIAGSSLTARIPNIQVTPSSGKKITVTLNNALHNYTQINNCKF